MTSQQRNKRKTTTMKQSLSLRRSNHLPVVIVTTHVLLYWVVLLGCKQVYTSTAQDFPLTPSNSIFKPTAPIISPAAPPQSQLPIIPSQQPQPQQQQPRPPNFGFLPCTICTAGETMTSAAAYIPIGTLPFIDYLLTCLELEIMSLNVELSPSNCQYIQLNTTIPQEICDCRKVNPKPTLEPILVVPTQIPPSLPTSLPASIVSNTPTTSIPVQTTIPVPTPIQSNLPTTKAPILPSILPTTAVPIPTNIPTIVPALTTIPSTAPTAQPVVTNTPTVVLVPTVVTTTAPVLSMEPTNTPSSGVSSAPTTVLSLYQVNGTIRIRLFYLNETMKNETIQQYETSYTNFLSSKLNSSVYTNITSKLIEQQLVDNSLAGPFIALSRNGTKNQTLASFMNGNNENTINSNNNTRKNRLERTKRSLQQQDTNVTTPLSNIPPLDTIMFIGALSPDSNSTNFIKTVITISENNLEELFLSFRNISTVLNTKYFETLNGVTITDEFPSVPVLPPVPEPERNGLNTVFIVAVVLLVSNLVGFIGFKVYTTYIRTNENNSNNSDDEDINYVDAPEINPSPSLVGVTVTMLEADGRENFQSDGDTSLSAPDFSMYGAQKTKISTPPVTQASTTGSTIPAVGTTLAKQAIVSDVKRRGSGTKTSTAAIATPSTGLVDIPEESISQSNNSMLYMDQIEVFSQAEQMKFMEGSAVDDDDDGEKDLSYAYSLGISESSYDSSSDITKEVKSTTSSSILDTGTHLTTTTRVGRRSATSALDTSTEDEEINRLFANPDTMIQRTVIVPAGKLGIAIDTTIEGPVVIEIFTNSPLDGKLFVGDVIVSIDNVDTRAMSKSTLTELMAQNTHRSRTFSVLSTNDIGL